MRQKTKPASPYAIAVITCWYGDYPWYFPYYIHSCGYNPSIDFFIITDNETTIPNKPDNVKIIHKTIGDIKKSASEKLGFPVNLNEPYKLCDFKPTYGFIFSDIVKGYHFWGHADIDIVYGDIRTFMTDEVLATHDVVSCRHDYITGSFCLFKNNHHCNTLFMNSKDYKTVLGSSIHFCFDECNFLFRQLEKGASIFDFPQHIQSMTYVVKDAERNDKLKVHFDFIIVEGTPGHIKWSNGRIYYKEMYEAMYYHLIKFKTAGKKPKIFDPIPDTLYFTPKTIRAHI